MAGYSSTMKRKNLEDTEDKFYDFPLFTPATKIRRLNAEIPPDGEEECEIPMNFDPPEPQKQGFGSSNFGGLRIVELPSQNEERAIVLFNPLNNLSQLPSSLSVSVDTHIISGLKNQVRWSSESNAWRLAITEQQTTNTDSPRSTNGCLAVVPWVPSTLTSSDGTELSGQLQNSDLMDTEEAMETTMEVEEDDDTRFDQMYFSGPIAAGHFLSRQQPQHCLISDLPRNLAAPISWYR